MSYDFEIAVHQLPRHESVVAWLAKRSVTVAGELGREGVRVARRVRGGMSVGFSVDGPFRVDLTDLESPLREAVLAPRWLLQVSVPEAADNQDRALARGLAREVARTCRGAAYDPQARAFVFSSSGTRRFRASREDERISVLTLLWALPPLRDPSVADGFLAAVRHVPEARPTRFGTYEPLQGRLALTDDQPFVAAWRDELTSDSGGSLIWKGTRPFLDGSVSFPDWRRRAPDSRRIDQVAKITLQLDGRALDDSAWRDETVELFLQVAVRLAAVHAVGYLEHGYINRGRTLWTDSQTEHTREFIYPRGFWNGLPRAPSWLTWFGPAYADQSRNSLGDTARPVADGLLLQLGARPQTREHLENTYPTIPEHLLVRVRTREERRELRRRAIHDRTIHPATIDLAPAEWLPTL